MKREIKKKIECERELACNLTDAEVLCHSRELAKRQQDLQQLDMQLASVKADYKDKMTRCETDIAVLSRKVVNGYEHRIVQCHWEVDYKEGTKHLYREDTGEFVEQAPLTMSERQEALGLTIIKKEQEG